MTALGHVIARRVAPIALPLGMLCAAPEPSHAAPLGHDVMLLNAKTGKCLTIAGGVSTDNNVLAVQFSCDGDLSRRWTIRLKL